MYLIIRWVWVHPLEKNWCIPNWTCPMAALILNMEGLTDPSLSHYFLFFFLKSWKLPFYLPILFNFCDPYVLYFCYIHLTEFVEWMIFLVKLLVLSACSPVDCIHWTSAAQLSLLEDEMRRIERVNVSYISHLTWWSMSVTYPVYIHLRFCCSKMLNDFTSCCQMDSTWRNYNTLDVNNLGFLLIELS